MKEIPDSQNDLPDFYLKEIVNGIHEAVLVVDINTVVTFVNQAYCRLFQVTPGKIVGRKISSIEPDATVVQVLKTGKPILGRLFKLDSTNAFVICNAKPLLRHGLLQGVVSVIRDITEIIQLSNALKHITNLPNNHELHNKVHFQADGILGSSLLLQHSLQLASKVAKTDVNILVTGETGTGKELITRAIHANSLRSASPFISLNCASIPESLFESELFGYESGAFSGASAHGKPGKFELANHGTLFLDEIGELSPTQQAKLLRVIDVREIDKVGGKSPLKIDIRIISATNRDLLSEIKAGGFRSDLYHRLSTIIIDLPPLRNRTDDIIALANHFISTLSEKTGKEYSLSIDACKHLLDYFWPGNIRELHNIITRACLTSEDGFVDSLDLPLSGSDTAVNVQRDTLTASTYVQEDLDFNSHIMLKEKSVIEKALNLSNGNKTEAIRLLKMNRKTFYNKLKKLGINH